MSITGLERSPAHIPKKHQLESLVGTLQHACMVIPTGKAFMRRIISLLSVAKQKHHHIQLNKEFKSDMGWWQLFATHWNRSALIRDSLKGVLEITSDASGTGCVLCPVAAVLGYIAVRGREHGPFFRFKNGEPLTKPAFTKHVRSALQTLGLPYQDFAGHSFGLGQPQLLQERQLKTRPFKCWEGGAALHSWHTSGNWHRLQPL